MNARLRYFLWRHTRIVEVVAYAVMAATIVLALLAFLTT